MTSPAVRQCFFESGMFIREQYHTAFQLSLFSSASFRKWSSLTGSFVTLQVEKTYEQTLNVTQVRFQQLVNFQSFHVRTIP
ncbi:hypothetical protein Mal48_19520 [Thalassoglobus polymorphus]|uniref:Uncharacterized protein n=1 Tax=Thalassoglobus polymorphus TaxID=2527994 RepID=A0A517QM75_9PLAN|nr:hypothetical protein Mal48_19520 [Thalassoglobus polymorphus]